MTNNKSLGNQALEMICKNKLVRTYITRRSPLWFFNIYFADHMEFETAPFQYEMIDLINRDDWKLLCIVAFRGSSKTTLMTTTQVLWSILGKRQSKFALIISATQAQAKQQMMNIRGVLEHNDTLKNDLGPFRDETDQWGGTTIVFTKLGARISVVSVNESIRGIKHLQHRPELVVIDDPEDIQSAKTRDGREKIYNWFKGEVMPIGSKQPRIVVLGNVVHEHCLVMKLKQEITEGTTTGIYKEYALIDENGESMWPGKFPTPKDLEEEKRRIGNDRTWYREYLLKIIPDEDQIIPKEYIHYYDVMPARTVENKFRFAVSSVDLAVKDKEGADYTAIVSAYIYGYGRDMKIYILPYPVNKRMRFPAIIATIKEVSKRIGGGVRTRAYVEGNAAQSYAVQQLEYDGFYIKEIISRGDKSERLACISPSLQNAQVLFPQKGCELLISQVVNFGLEDHDDLCDALVMLVSNVLEEGGKYSPFPNQGPKKPDKGEDDDRGRPITAGLLKIRF